MLPLHPTAEAAPFAMMFEGIAPPAAGTGTATPHTGSGFLPTSNETESGIFDSAASANTNGTDIFGWCGGCDPQVLTVTGPGVFDLVSIDVASLDTDNLVPGTGIGVAGFFSGGGSTLVTLPITTTWTTHPLAGFVNLLSVQIVASGIDDLGGELEDPAIDNLQFKTGEAVVP
jgi:hypothetical protein